MLRIAKYNKITGKKVDLKELEKFGFRKFEYTDLLVLRKKERDYAYIDIRNKQYGILDLCNLTYNLTYDLITAGYVEKFEEE